MIVLYCAEARRTQVADATCRDTSMENMMINHTIWGYWLSRRNGKTTTSTLDQKLCPSLLSGTALMHRSLDTQCPARKRLCEGHPISKSLSKYEGDCTRLIAPGTKTKYLTSVGRTVGSLCGIVRHWDGDPDGHMQYLVPWGILLRGLRIKTVAFPGAVALHAHFVAFGHLWTTKKPLSVWLPWWYCTRPRSKPFFKGEGGGQAIIITFFSLGGGREITISASREGEAATPTLGVRGEGGGNWLLLLFFLWGGGGR